MQGVGGRSEVASYRSQVACPKLQGERGCQSASRPGRTKGMLLVAGHKSQEDCSLWPATCDL